MITEEYYKREYLYREGERQTGLKFKTNHSAGFTPVDGHLSKLSISSIFKRIRVGYGDLSEKAQEYILQEFRHILEGEPSPYRITTIYPSPNQIRLGLEATHLDGSLSDDALRCELVNYGQVIVDISGEDRDEKHVYAGELTLMRLECVDEINPDESCFITLHVSHHSSDRSGWKDDRAVVKTRHSQSCTKRQIRLRWKDATMERMAAEIEETS